MRHVNLKRAGSMALLLAALLTVVLIVTSCAPPCRGWSCDDRNTVP